MRHTSDAHQAYKIAKELDPQLAGIWVPDPTDQTISKRRWEMNIQTIVQALKAKITLYRMGMHG